MRVFVMALEPLDTRYTGQWYEGLPRLLREQAAAHGVVCEVVNVPGEQVSTEVTAGAFLNFTATNIWKNTQMNTLAQWFSDGTVQAGDRVLFTDAWHTGVVQTRYMSELMDVPVEIHSMWHAGSYDPQDFLGRKVKDKRWSLSFEKSAFYASDFNWFATKFHAELFRREVLDDDMWFVKNPRIHLSGQPHNVLVDSLQPFRGMTKKRQVLFPHRVAPEKQPEIFRDLALHMPDVTFIVCQDERLTKQQYHDMLGESMVIFSANLQETLGISAMEGILVDALPMLPDRLSYSEMYEKEFLYDSSWTANWSSYEANRSKVVGFLRNMLDNYAGYQSLVDQQRDRLLAVYLSAGPMINSLLGISK